MPTLAELQEERDRLYAAYQHLREETILALHAYLDAHNAWMHRWTATKGEGP